MYKDRNCSQLAIVIPCYNEEAVLPVTVPLFLQELSLLIQKKLVSDDSFLLFVNDGSKDNTWNLIQEYSAKNSSIKGLSLSRNRGHQNALLAGLMTARHICEVTISIDCDGQDDIIAMEQMMEDYIAGSEIVYGVRMSRKTDSFFKRVTAQGFYKLLNAMGAEVVYNHADYRLMSSLALDALSKYEEVNLFLRGMVPLVGFKSSSVYYERTPRLAGESHYPLKKMLALAFNGITSLSVKPIRMITSFGIFVSILSFIGIIWSIVTACIGNSVAGWASMVSIMCFLGGIQLLSLGVIGEYIGKIYLEVKKRPRYIIEKKCGFGAISKGEFDFDS